MFEFFWSAIHAVKEVFVWAAWLGIGATPLIIGAIVVWLDPKVLRPAIIAGGIWLAVFGAYTLGDSVGAARVQEKWDEAKVEYAEKLEEKRAENEKVAQQNVDLAGQLEKKKDVKDEQGVKDFAQNKAVADCGGIGDDDLRAAGRLQRLAPTQPARRRYWFPRLHSSP